MRRREVSSSKEAFLVVVPAPTASTSPLAEIVATLSSSTSHVTSKAASGSNVPSSGLRAAPPEER